MLSYVMGTLSHRTEWRMFTDTDQRMEIKKDYRFYYINRLDIDSIG